MPVELLTPLEAQNSRKSDLELTPEKCPLAQGAASTWKLGLTLWTVDLSRDNIKKSRFGPVVTNETYRILDVG